MEGSMSEHQKNYILGELRQLRQVESLLHARFKALGTAKVEARMFFIVSLEEWKMRAQVLDNLLDQL
jgi:hypothetical protein